MILLDTGIIVARASAKDQHHARAVEIMNEIDEGKYGTLVITDYVFDEAMTLLLSRLGDVKAIAELGDKILSSGMLISTDTERFMSAWQIFKTQRKTRLSFTDCTILACCKITRIEVLATFDNTLGIASGMTIIN